MKSSSNNMKRMFVMLITKMSLKEHMKQKGTSFIASSFSQQHNSFRGRRTQLFSLCLKLITGCRRPPRLINKCLLAPPWWSLLLFNVNQIISALTAPTGNDCCGPSASNKYHFPYVNNSVQDSLCYCVWLLSFQNDFSNSTPCPSLLIVLV